jgi:hypothetical protein
MSEARVIIRWVPKDEGGRARPPHPVAGYSAPLRFRDQPRDREAWSTKLMHATPLKSPGYFLARMQFIMPNAPHDRLTRGAAFELVEGPNIVARGVVLPSNVRVPTRLTEFEKTLLQ